MVGRERQGTVVACKRRLPAGKAGQNVAALRPDAGIVGRERGEPVEGGERRVEMAEGVLGGGDKGEGGGIFGVACQRAAGERQGLVDPTLGEDDGRKIGKDRGTFGDERQRLAEARLGPGIVAGIDAIETGEEKRLGALFAAHRPAIRPAAVHHRNRSIGEGEEEVK